MSNPEKITPEIKEPERENLLPKKIRDGLNKIRESGISFHEKAEKLFLLLKEANCQEIRNRKRLVSARWSLPPHRASGSYLICPPRPGGRYKHRQEEGARCPKHPGRHQPPCA